MYKKILFIIIFAVLTLPALVSCSDLDPKTVNALAIIYGNTANRNATTTQSYEAAIPFIKETVYGGYIAVISGDGKPEVIRNFEFKTDANSDYILDKRKTNYTNTVVKFLKSDFTRAKMPEIDLLKAIDEAKKALNAAEDKALMDGKKIGKKQIVIFSSCLVTSGDMSLIKLGFDRIDFAGITNGELDEYIKNVAVELAQSNLLPDLSGIGVTIIGLGDVAGEQELTKPERNAIEKLMKEVLKECGASEITVTDYPSGNKPNLYISDDDGYPYVTTINFIKTTKFDVFPIPISEPPPTLTIDFVVDSADYINKENAEILIYQYAEQIYEYLNTTDGKVYIVGAHSKGKREPYYDTSLSERRAAAVKDTLVQFGIPESRLIVIGIGEFEPWRLDEFPNGTFSEETAKKNRRVLLIASYYVEHVNAVLEIKEELNSMT